MDGLDHGVRSSWKASISGSVPGGVIEAHPSQEIDFRRAAEPLPATVDA
jgi:hypothetical protein